MGVGFGLRGVSGGGGGGGDGGVLRGHFGGILGRRKRGGKRTRTQPPLERPRENLITTAASAWYSTRVAIFSMGKTIATGTSSSLPLPPFLHKKRSKKTFQTADSRLLSVRNANNRGRFVELEIQNLIDTIVMN